MYFEYKWFKNGNKWDNYIYVCVCLVVYFFFFFFLLTYPFIFSWLKASSLHVLSFESWKHDCGEELYFPRDCESFWSGVHQVCVCPGDSLAKWLITTCVRENDGHLKRNPFLFVPIITRSECFFSTPAAVISCVGIWTLSVSSEWMFAYLWLSWPFSFHTLIHAHLHLFVRVRKVHAYIKP